MDVVTSKAGVSKSATATAASSSHSSHHAGQAVASLVLPTASIIQLPPQYYQAAAHQQAPTTATSMQFYTQSAAIAHNQAANSDGGGGGASGSNNSAPVQLQQQQTYINPALAYQQWFGLQLQQQQQQQQQQDGQVTFATIPNSSGEGGNTVAFSYMDPQSHQNVEFHNGSVQMAADGALSLSTLQSFANSLQHSQPGQAFMIQATPVQNANGLTTLQYTTNQGHDQHHGHQTHQNQQQVTTSAKSKGARKPKAAPQVQHVPHVEVKAAKPPKPKGSPNAYALFYKDTYAKLRAENPEWKASQIMAEAGKIWKEMNGNGQEAYRSRAETLNQAHQLANAAANKSHKKQKNQQKRPMTAYQLFIREHFGRRPPEVAQMHAKDFLLQLSVQWKNLEPAEKQMYQDKAKVEKTRREAENELANGQGSNVLTQAPVKLESGSVPTGFSSTSS
ncbi:hypothetical protein BV898_03477 [Hypsibius exemplaris]|uniref:HMG box domain-containing protein n=1 Tax=Hypsibius exemplaris TaxID=2072580 RepID=A0A1W0X5Q7_HYPEX|nr:hypothetical protein BV898_03477 [Hypsibius exemplaris]